MICISCINNVHILTTIIMKATLYIMIRYIQPFMRAQGPNAQCMHYRHVHDMSCGYLLPLVEADNTASTQFDGIQTRDPDTDLKCFDDLDRSAMIPLEGIIAVYSY